MTTPVLGWAPVVPASPFGGPSKMLGHLLALYGGSPILWRAVGSRIMWGIIWRRELWPCRAYGGSQAAIGSPSCLGGTSGVCTSWSALPLPAAPAAADCFGMPAESGHLLRHGSVVLHGLLGDVAVQAVDAVLVGLVRVDVLGPGLGYSSLYGL